MFCDGEQRDKDRSELKAAVDNLPDPMVKEIYIICGNLNYGFTDKSELLREAIREIIIKYRGNR